MKLSTTFFILVAMATNSAQAAWFVKQTRTQSKVTVESITKIDRIITEEKIVLRSLPEFLSEGSEESASVYEELLYRDDALPSGLTTIKASSTFPKKRFKNLEVKTLVDQGPTRNRINLTIVGDGYTESERTKFFDDAERITKDLFTGHTFASYLPLFNVYAIFVPSKDSGISDLTKKNTALGLRRDPKGSKRAIMPGNSFTIDRILEKAPATDFPILLANDDYYGGLGGKYAITTRSEKSGTIVLRHELGHNFGSVGEEYDNGYVYTGANFSATPNIPWKHWLAEGVSQPFISEAQFLSGEYAWKNLKTAPYVTHFKISESIKLSRLFVLVSVVGWETPEDVSIYLDGAKIEYPGSFGVDRTFFTLELDRTLAPGNHTLEFRENIKDNDNVLGFAEVYATPSSYDWNPGAYGAFANFYHPGKLAGYRPTHDSCLMRNMLTENFCSVDKENMWVRFLDRVSLIDSLGVESGKVVLKTPSLPNLKIHWYRIDKNRTASEIIELRDQKEFPLSGKLAEPIRVEVSFSTPEVRMESSRFKATAEIQ